MNTFFRAVAATAATLFLTGCMAKQNLPGEYHGQGVWNHFLSISTEHAPGKSAGTVLGGSLRFGTPDDTRRVTFMLWSSNGMPEILDEAQETLPETRMEVYAGAGPSICSALFKDGQMTVLMHQERQAWSGRADKENMRRLLGITMPMDLPHIYAFLTGNYLAATGNAHPVGEAITDAGKTVIDFGRKAEIQKLTLLPNGTPVRVTTQNGWDLSVSYASDQLPSKLDGRKKTVDGEMRFILMVKERSQKQTPGEHSHLAIPPGYRAFLLDE